MERNLYEPPAAPVADPAETFGDRPAQVAWAVWLMWVSVAVGVISTVVQYTGVFNLYMVVLVLAGSAGRTAIAAWLILKTSARRNWARILLLLWFLYAIGVIVWRWQVYIGSFTAGPRLATATWVIKSVLDCVALILLFTPAANRWFKQ
jgi:hypothetical protein